MAAEKLVNVILAGLAGELRHVRLDKGFTIDQACADLKWYGSKLSRMERGRQCISLEDLGALLAIYKVTGAERRRLLDMTERQDDPGHWEHNATDDVESRTLLRLEAEARMIVAVEPTLIPELAQTPEYASAVLRAHGVPAEQVELRVEARMDRQAILTSRTRPKFGMVLDEVALRRVVGDRAIMARQLRALLEIVERPNMGLWVMPFGQGGNAGMDSPFSEMDFPGGDRVVYLRQETSGIFYDDYKITEPFHQHASRLAKIALDGPASVRLIAGIAREYD